MEKNRTYCWFKTNPNPHVAQMQTKLLTLLTISNFIIVNSLKVVINNVSVLMDHNWMLIRGIIIIKPQRAIRFMAS